MTNGSEQLSFRIRFNLPDSLRVNSDKSELLLSNPKSKYRVVLKCQRDKTILESSKLRIVAEGFDTEQDAEDAALRWRDITEAVMAHEYFGVDFGDTASSKGVLTTAGIEMLEKEYNRRVLNDVHGTMVFETKPDPLFFETTASAVKQLSSERMLQVYMAAQDVDFEVSDEERIAYDLFASSYLYLKPDARFLTLMMAIETLAVRQPREQRTVTHLELLITQTKQAELSDTDSLVHALSDMKNESIGKSCRALGLQLGDRLYAGMKPDKFIGHCYTLRSQLVHGTSPRPDNQTINSVVADLERFVGDLLGQKTGVELHPMPSMNQ